MSCWRPQIAKDRLSAQRHYDFQMRTLKSVLIIAAQLRSEKAAQAAAAAADAAAAAAAAEAGARPASQSSSRASSTAESAASEREDAHQGGASDPGRLQGEGSGILGAEKERKGGKGAKGPVEVVGRLTEEEEGALCKVRRHDGRARG